MKKLALRGIALLLCLLLTGTAEALESVDDSLLVLENSFLRLAMDKNTTQFTVEALSDGYVWYSNPPDQDSDNVAKGTRKKLLNTVFYADCLDELYQVSVRYIANSDCVEKGMYEISMPDQQTIRVDYRFEFMTNEPDGRQNVLNVLRIPILYSLNGNSLIVRVDTAGIEQTYRSKLMTLTLLPFFGATKSTDGYLFVPSGCGAVMDLSGQENYMAYSTTVYSSDQVAAAKFAGTKQERVLLPVFAVHEGNHSLMTILSSGEEGAILSVDPAGKKTSYAAIYAGYVYGIDNALEFREKNGNMKTLRKSTTGKVPEYFETTYLFLSGESAEYPGMAMQYRNFLLKGDADAASDKRDTLFVDILGSYTDNRKVMGLNIKSVKPLTTYAQAADILRALEDGGVSKLSARYRGWMGDGLLNYQLWTDNPTPLAELGGEAEWQALTRYASNNQIELFPEAEFVRVRRSGNGFNLRDGCAKNLTGTQNIEIPFYSLATGANRDDIDPWNVINPLLLPARAATFIQNASDLNTRGFALSSLGDLLYSTGGEESFGMWQTRGAFADVTEKIQQAGYEVLLEQPNAYLAKDAQVALCAPMFSSRSDLFTYDVPFYQMVFGAGRELTSTPFNLSSDRKALLLKCVEFGCVPLWQVMEEQSSVLSDLPEYSSFYCANFGSNQEEILSCTQTFAQLRAVGGNCVVASHRRLANGVFETTYENGARAVTNYSSDAYVLEESGVQVLPMDYVVIEVGAE